jgi:hypothetical protein
MLPKSKGFLQFETKLTLNWHLTKNNPHTNGGHRECEKDGMTCPLYHRGISLYHRSAGTYKG